MQARLYQQAFAPALAAAGAAFGALAAADKVFGLVQRPLHLATAAYASLAALLVLACLRGVTLRPARILRLSGYAATVLLCFLTAGFLFAWRAISADPAPLLVSAQLAEGDALLAQGEKDLAHLRYREAHRRLPNSFQVLVRLGAVNYQVADYTRAERYFSQALAQAPPDSRWRALNHLGQTYWKLGRPREAIDHYLRAREEGLPNSRPELIEWHYRLGWAYFDVRDYDAAIEHYEAVANFGGKYADAAYYNVACALAQKLKGAPAGARAALAADAVANLREAWRLTTEGERDAFKNSLTGPRQGRDPELAPLEATPEFSAFLRTL
jgi:tetratricopeptide (TPR) repeat protein